MNILPTSFNFKELENWRKKELDIFVLFNIKVYFIWEKDLLWCDVYQGKFLQLEEKFLTRSKNESNFGDDQPSFLHHNNKNKIFSTRSS